MRMGVLYYHLFASQTVFCPSLNRDVSLMTSTFHHAGLRTRFMEFVVLASLGRLSRERCTTRVLRTYFAKHHPDL